MARIAVDGFHHETQVAKAVRCFAAGSNRCPNAVALPKVSGIGAIIRRLCRVVTGTE